jgi:polyhydroxyalkanoate synthase
LADTKSIAEVPAPTAPAARSRKKTDATSAAGERPKRTRKKAAPPAEAPAAAAAQTPPPAARPAAPSVDIMSMASAETMEKLAMNLWEASVRMQKITAEAVALQPPIGADRHPDPFRAQEAVQEVLAHAAADPATLVAAQTELWRGFVKLWAETYRVLLAGPDQNANDPLARDRRFTDPDWRKNALFDLLRRTYTFQSEWLQNLAARAPNIEPAKRRKAAFFLKQAADAFSPSNFVFTNPTVLKKTIETGGENLLRGLQMFEEDLKRGRGHLALRQTDMSPFKLGENIATTKGKVIFRNELFELIQYSPLTETVAETPVLFFPPWINKFYILDMRKDNSMVRWLTEQGHTVFVTSWVNPPQDLAEKTIEDYMKDGLMTAMRVVQEQTGVEKMHTVGYCVAGTLLGATLAYMAANNDDRVCSATFFTAQMDFEFAGDLLFFTDDAGIKYVEAKMDEAGGVLEGQVMSETFNALRAPDLYWSYVVSNYLLGEKPKPFDLLYWNSDQTRMPRALHLYYLRNFYRDNRFSKGELTIDGVDLDLSKVKTPSFFQAAKEDHIAPAKSVYKSARLMGGPVQFMLAGSGHIAGVVNPPAAKKYQHWTNSNLPDSLEEWLAAATEHPGSWWTSWNEWLKERDGPQIPARDPDNGPHKPICDAPGDYVRVRSDAP